MAEKRRCTNCGAFLENGEKVCYVCGEVQMPDVVTAPERSEKPRGSSMTFEKDEDFVMPAKFKGNKTSRDDKMDYGDDDIAEPYYKWDDMEKKSRKRHNRKQRKGNRAVIIAVVCILVVGIAGAVCFCLFNGVFGGGKKDSDKFTVYFDKPASDIELLKSDGSSFTWTNDVEVSYTVNGKTKTKVCTPCSDHESLWKTYLPKNAKSVYFFEKEEKGLRTQITPSFEDETVYYVSQVTLNAQNQLPLGQCERDSFEGIGINYATSAQTDDTEETTQPETTKETEQATTEKEEKATEEDDSRKTEDQGYYTVSLPKSWQSGVTAIKNGKCTTYYEDYNYNSYSMGKLVSIYVFDADDSAADNLTGVKDIRYNADQTKKIVITTPTDIQFNEADEQAQKKYLEKNKDLNSFLDSISVN